MERSKFECRHASLRQLVVRALRLRAQDADPGVDTLVARAVYQTSTFRGAQDRDLSVPFCYAQLADGEVG
jgi:hypothetical protein